MGNNVGILLTIIAVLSNLFLGFLVLVKDFRQRVHQVFFVFTVLLSLFTAASFLVDVPLGEYWQNVFLRLDFVSGVLGAYFFLLFTVYFPTRKPFVGPVLLRALGVIVVIFAFLSAATNLVIKEVYFTEAGLGFYSGPLDIAFIVFIIAVIVLGVFALIRQYLQVEGIRKLQVLYVLVGSSITVLFVSFSLISQRVAIRSDDPVLVTFGITVFPSVMRYGLLFLTGTTAYAILRHRLFGIRVVVGKLIFWLGAAAFLFGTFYVVALTELKFIGSFLHPSALIINIFIAILVALLFSVYEKNLRKVIERHIIRFSFDADAVIEEFIIEASAKISTEEIIRLLFETIEKTYQPSKQGILVASTQGRGEVVSEWQNFTQKEVDELEHREVINLFLDLRPGKMTFRSKNIVSRPHSHDMEKFELGMALPLFYHEVEGVYLLGQRKNGHAYTTEDISFLENLSFYASSNISRVL